MSRLAADDRATRLILQVLQDKRIGPALAPDVRVRPVARGTIASIAEREQDRGDRPHQNLIIATGQIGPTDGTGKQRVAHEQVSIYICCCADLQADATRAVAGRVMHTCLVVTELNGRAVVIGIDRRWLADLEPEHRPLLDGDVVEKLIIAVQIDRSIKRIPGSRDAGDVVHVRVGQQHRLDVDVEIANSGEQLVHFVAGVDEYGLASPPATDDKSVLVERGHCSYF